MKRLRLWAFAVLLGCLAMPRMTSADLPQYFDLNLQNAATSAVAGVSIPVSGYTSIAVDVAISATATVTFQVVGPGQSGWVNRTCVLTSDTTGALTTSATATGVYRCDVAGMLAFRASITSYGSGTITVNARAMVSDFGGGGGGGGGSVVDTELPAAVAAPSAGSAPTAPSVWAYIVCKASGAATYDPCTAGDNTAHDAADAGNPLKIGAKASSATSSRTSVSNNDRTDVYAGIDGILIVRPYSNLEDRVSGVLGNTDGASTSVVAAQGAGIRFCVTTVIIANSSATNVTVDLRDGTAGSVLATFPAAANMGGATTSLPVPLCTTANTAMAMDGSAAATTVTVTLVGFKTAL